MQSHLIWMFPNQAYTLPAVGKLNESCDVAGRSIVCRFGGAAPFSTRNYRSIEVLANAKKFARHTFLLLRHES